MSPLCTLIAHAVLRDISDKCAERLLIIWLLTWLMRLLVAMEIVLFLKNVTAVTKMCYVFYHSAFVVHNWGMIIILLLFLVKLL